jgi:hypothetical protein
MYLSGFMLASFTDFTELASSSGECTVIKKGKELQYLRKIYFFNKNC